ncbi:two-component system, response regulator [Methylomarinovum caldicuralii]|uniref:Two-component system, response regulator n=1 Tax=Methylomarinovum caldicuralii TaxID=438856 RepID=A0AAU9C5Q3_9GAMM|nr:two-component system, response regulator [Methylomarinovum caldicuralii]
MANRVEVVRDGAEALDYLFATGPYAHRAGKELPAVVLLDLMLPKLSGLEVLARIRGDSRTRRLPVVILTSSDDEKDLVRSYYLGSNSYVRKPIDPGEFTRAVAQVGLYWLALNQPPPPSQ